MLFSAEQVIDSLYRAVLHRAPDVGGLTAYSTRLKSDPSALPAIVQGLLDSEEYNIILGRSTGLTDHSQFKEFPLLLRHLVDDGCPTRLIVDVGARGRERSNSYDLLSQFGWKGILVEANPELYDEIESGFEGTDFTLIKCAVGAKEGKMPFYIGSNDDVSSLLKEAAAGWGELRGQVAVEVKRLGQILRDQKVPPDFEILSLDIEGVDVAVLNDLIDNSFYRPRYVIIEASYSFRTKQLSDVGCSTKVQNTYDIVEQTEANLILQRRP